MKALEVVWGRGVACLAAGLLLNCGGGYGGDGGGSDPPATLQIAVEPDTITLGESATISWSSNARSCQASGDWGGSKAATGSHTVTPAEAGTFTYTLVCGGGRYSDSDAGSATLTVNPVTAAGAWIGDACCASAQSFEVAGLTSEAGGRRVLALGTHWVGDAGKTPVAYGTCEDCLAGTRLAQAPPLPQIRSPLRSRAEAVSETSLQGNYTTFLANGYTLSLAIDAEGGLIGADTNGCSLRGQVVGPRAANVFEVRHEVTSCGARDGRYAGEAALLPARDGQPAELMLSTSNADAAIGWRLAR